MAEDCRRAAIRNCGELMTAYLHTKSRNEFVDVALFDLIFVRNCDVYYVEVTWTEESIM